MNDNQIQDLINEFNDDGKSITLFENQLRGRTRTVLGDQKGDILVGQLEGRLWSRIPNQILEQLWEQVVDSLYKDLYND